MEYKMITQNGYILGVGEVATGGNISREEYERITDIIHQMPIAPDGFCYRLTESLGWELCLLPTIEEEATETDYRNALREMGVEV